MSCIKIGTIPRARRLTFSSFVKGHELAN